MTTLSIAVSPALIGGEEGCWVMLGGIAGGLTLTVAVLEFAITPARVTRTQYFAWAVSGGLVNVDDVSFATGEFVSGETPEYHW